MGQFWADYWMFICGLIAILVLVGILIFLRSRKTDE